MKKVLICFSAGCAGAIANSQTAWVFGIAGITGMAGVSMAPALTPAWLYPRIVWGGIWGLIFILPFLGTRPLVKGTVLSIFPTFVQLFVVFPYKAHKGVGGLELGMLTPLFVVLYNAVWGVVTALIVKQAR